MAARKPVVHAIACVDRSGSIQTSRLTDDVINVVNAWQTRIQVNAAKTPSRITLITFASDVKVPVECQDPSQMQLLNRTNYDPDGGTGIFNAIKVAIESAKRFMKKTDIAVVNIFTDGLNNVDNHTVPLIVREMKGLIELGNWTFTFQMPEKYINDFISRWGIDPGNVAPWETTKAGTQAMQEQTTSGLDGFYDAVRSGKRQLRDYFTVDLKALKKADLNKLKDLSKQFKSYTVTKEMEIKDFVESKTGKGYVKGSAFYTLMKKEKIQKSKEVMIYDNRTGRLYGGPEARDIVGLPADKDQWVLPGNMGDFILYVKSTSVNRALVRGTRVLIDPKKVKNDPSTWDDSVRTRSAKVTA